MPIVGVPILEMELKPSNRKEKFTQKEFFLVRISPNKDQSFSDKLDSSISHLDFCNNRDICGCLIYNLNSRNLEGLGLDGGGGRPSSNGENDMDDVKKLGRRILRLRNSPFQVFDIILCLFSHIFFRQQILQHFGNHLKDLPQTFFPYL